MKIEFGVPKMLFSTTTPNPGAFALPVADGNAASWITCRDTFHSTFTDKVSGFYFSFNSATATPEGIAAFIARTEEIIGFRTICPAPAELLPPPEKRPICGPTRYSKTNRPFALWVEPSAFWRECELRRSLFTILLRCGASYKPEADNYDQALLSVSYISETFPAMKRFLFGYTKMNRDRASVRFSGAKQWYTLFVKQEVPYVRSVLEWPPDEPKPDFPNFQQELLWS